MSDKHWVYPSGVFGCAVEHPPAITAIREEVTCADCLRRIEADKAICAACASPLRPRPTTHVCDPGNAEPIAPLPCKHCGAVGEVIPQWVEGRTIFMCAPCAAKMPDFAIPPAREPTEAEIFRLLDEQMAESSADVRDDVGTLPSCLNCDHHKSTSEHYGTMLQMCEEHARVLEQEVEDARRLYQQMIKSHNQSAAKLVAGFLQTLDSDLPAEKRCELLREHVKRSLVVFGFAYIDGELVPAQSDLF